FYDDVVGPSAQDEELLRKLPFEENEERERMGLAGFIGNSTGQDLKRRYYFEPSCNIAGIISGFTQPNTSKTVLPAEIMVKIDMRLVPNQDPDDIYEKLRAHLDKRGFEDIELKHYSMEHPVLSPSDSLVGRAALAAAEGIFEEEPAVAPLMIGTGPMWPIAHKLGIPTVSTAGVHRPDSMIHAPNENCRIEDYLDIAEYTAAYLKTFSELDT
ncbi:MAG: M20/M25/M40 family metallo-hydrolase, partial [Actinobacteria bacterium]|nr:M20/M25/M40 family metallo-hydrolase [Actinomycetota bacterium]